LKLEERNSITSAALVEMCKDTPAGFEDMCLENVGRANADFSVCAIIQDINLKNDCMMHSLLQKQDIGKCKEIGLDYDFLPVVQVKGKEGCEMIYKSHSELMSLGK
jgi:hypothetical protein